MEFDYEISALSTLKAKGCMRNLRWRTLCGGHYLDKIEKEFVYVKEDTDHDTICQQYLISRFRFKNMTLDKECM